MDIKVSVVIPAYNIEKYVGQCLESVLNQVMKNIEIIIIDDGSVDATLEIIEQYKNLDNLIIKRQENNGQGFARNIGINCARGQYIYFLDGDDYIDKMTLEECYKISKVNNLDILIFDGKVFYDSEYEGNYKDYGYDRSEILESSIYWGETLYNFMINNNCYRPSVCIHFYNREFLIKNNLYFHEGIYNEDELFNMKAVILAKRIMYIPKFFFHRRIRSDSTMTRKTSKKNITSKLIVGKEMTYFIESAKLKKTTVNNIIKQIRWIYLLALKEVLIIDENKITKYILKRKIRNELKKNRNIITTDLLILSYSSKLYYICNAIKLKLIKPIINKDTQGG